MSQNRIKSIWPQAACLVLAAMGLGLAGNALNPAGLAWREDKTRPAPNGGNGPGKLGVYQNESLYANETLPLAPASAAPREFPATTQGARSNSVSMSKAIGASTAAAVALAPAAIPLRSTWEEVKPLAASGQIVLVDARPRTAFDAGHIPGAVSLPFQNLQAEIQAFMGAHPPGTPLAIYCANVKCGTSSQLALALTRTYQYQNVRFVPGGYQEWRSAEGGRQLNP
jgi:rhodanese-related sulfurtransferase